MRWLFLFLLFTSCAQRVKVPINRMVSPEAIGGGAEIEYKQMGFSHGLLDFSGAKTDNSLVMGSVKNTELYLGLGVSQNADLFIKIPEESTSLLGVKVQVIGDPSKARGEGHKLSFTLAMGAERDSFEGDYKVKLKADAQDFSLIHGYRFSPTLMVYEGVTYSKYVFEGTVEESGFADPNFSYTADNVIGAHAGLELGSAAFKLKLELGSQRIQWSHSDAKLYQYFGYSLAASF
ncbi:MAG: hypothetical protein WD025_06350 [Bacteriovoracaceae bacterium]